MYEKVNIFFVDVSEVVCLRKPETEVVFVGGSEKSDIAGANNDGIYSVL